MFLAPKVAPVAKNPDVLTYRALRKAVGIVAIGLPFALAIPLLFLPGGVLASSISGYYYTGMRDLFVGSLCAISMFMGCCRGYDRADRIAGVCSSLFALGVAFFPTEPDFGMTPLQHRVGIVHYVFAALLFLTLAYFCLVLFRMTAENKTVTRKKRQRNGVYLVCGWIIVGSVLSLALLKLFEWLGWFNVGSLREKLHTTICFETLALVAFGFAWLVKGEGLLKDEGVISSATVTSDALFAAK